MYIWQFTKSGDNLPNVTLAVGGAPCFEIQASLFNFKTRLNASFFEQERLKFDLTLKVLATNHYIENTRKGKKKDSPNVIKKSTQCNEKSTQCYRLGRLEKG
jgi:hypothetical protein